jgi:hypothetical protein
MRKWFIDNSWEIGFGTAIASYFGRLAVDYIHPIAARISALDHCLPIFGVLNVLSLTGLFVALNNRKDDEIELIPLSNAAKSFLHKSLRWSMATFLVAIELMLRFCNPNLTETQLYLRHWPLHWLVLIVAYRLFVIYSEEK